MDTDNWAELLKYASPNSIMVVTWEYKVIELPCPFRAEVIHKVGILVPNTIVEVERVQMTIQWITVFIVDAEPYYYYHFHILVD